MLRSTYYGHDDHHQRWWWWFWFLKFVKFVFNHRLIDGEKLQLTDTKCLYQESTHRNEKKKQKEWRLIYNIMRHGFSQNKFRNSGFYSTLMKKAMNSVRVLQCCQSKFHRIYNGHSCEIHSFNGKKRQKKKWKENPFCFMSTEKMYVVKFNFNSYNDNKQPQHTSIEEKIRLIYSFRIDIFYLA